MKKLFSLVLILLFICFTADYFIYKASNTNTVLENGKEISKIKMDSSFQESWKNYGK